MSEDHRKRTQRARRAARATVPGFPEIVRRWHQCRLCNLVEKAPDVLRQVHLLWTAGFGVKALQTETLHLWHARGEVPVDHKCFDRHFRGHVDFRMGVLKLEEDDMTNEHEDELLLPPPPAEGLPELDAPTAVVMTKQKAAKAIATAAAAAPPPPPVALVAKAQRVAAAVAAPAPAPTQIGRAVSLRAKTADEGALGKDNSDYYEMWDLIERLKRRVHEVDEKASFVDEEGRVDNYALVLWMKSVGELVRAIEALNRIRNADRVTKAVVQAHTKRMVQYTSDPLVATFQIALADAERGDLSSLRRLGGGQVQDIIFRAAEQAVKESCELYKLN